MPVCFHPDGRICIVTNGLFLLCSRVSVLALVATAAAAAAAAAAAVPLLLL